MGEDFGSDFITIVDEDGTEYELEVLLEQEYNGSTYLAVIPAGLEDDEKSSLEISILKCQEEDGESILCAVEDDRELEAVYNIIMENLYEEDEE